MQKALDVTNDGGRSCSTFLQLSDTGIAVGKYWCSRAPLLFRYGCKEEEEQPRAAVGAMGRHVEDDTAKNGTLSAPPSYDLVAGHHRAAELAGSWEQAPLVELAVVERAPGELMD